MRRSIILLAVMALAMSITAPALAARGGDAGSPIKVDLIYADGELHDTILQKGLKYNGNEESYDLLYMVPGQMNPVAEAAPGNPAYNGGRWIPTDVVYDGSLGVLTSYADLMAAVDAGVAEIGDSHTDMAFLCPLVRNGR